MTTRLPKLLSSLALGLALAQPLAAQVGTLDPADVGGSQADLGLLGPSYTSVPSGAAIPVDGVTMTISSSTGQAMERRDNDPCAGWGGDFAGCEKLVWTGGTTGPVTFAFDQMISGFGVDVMANYYGPFTASISVYRDAMLLGTFGGPGVADQVNGTSLFLGMVATSAETMFNQVVLSVPTATAHPQDFAFGGPMVNSSALGTTVTPEPMSMALLGSGLLALGGVQLRRRRAAARAG